MFTMRTEDIKTELRDLIDNETDSNILEAIMTLLRKSRLNPVLKEKLTSRALKSEEDIRAGRVMERKDFEQRLNDKLGI